MVFSFIKKALGRVIEENSKAYVKNMKKLILAESLSCKKCNALSTPLYDSENKYKCTGCGRQFSNSKHNIGGKIRRKYNGNEMRSVYDRAVAEISL